MCGTEDPLINQYRNLLMGIAAIECYVFTQIVL